MNNYTMNFNNVTNYESSEMLNTILKLTKEKISMLNHENKELKQQINNLAAENSDLRRKNENMQRQLYGRTTTTINEDELLWESFINDFTQPYESEKRKNVLNEAQKALRFQIETTQENLVNIYNLINELGELL